MAICPLRQLWALCLELGCEGRRVVTKCAKGSLPVGWNWGRKKAQEVEMVHGPGARVGVQLSTEYCVLIQNSEESMKSKFKSGLPGC